MSETATIGGAFHLNFLIIQIVKSTLTNNEIELGYIEKSRVPSTHETDAPTVILPISEKRKERVMNKKLNAPTVGKKSVSRKGTCKESQ